MHNFCCSKTFEAMLIWIVHELNVLIAYMHKVVLFNIAISSEASCLIFVVVVWLKYLSGR